MTNNSNVMLKKHRSFTGTVVSDKNDKTITVEVVTSKTHPIYKKSFKSTKKYHAHDEKNQAKIGDVVKIIESRPLSALKRFCLLSIVSTKSTIVQNNPELAKEVKN